MAARFGLKSVDTILEELIKFLPGKLLTRAAAIRVAGKVLGVPAGVDDNFVLVQGAESGEVFPAGLILREPKTGILFAEETGSAVSTTGGLIVPGNKTWEQDPSDPSRAIVTLLTADIAALTGNLIKFAFPTGYDPLIDTSDPVFPQERTRATYIPGSAETGQAQFSYALSDPFASRSSPDFLDALFTVGPVATSVRMRALEEGSVSNLPDGTILVPSIDGSAPNLLNCVVSHIAQNTGGNGFDGGEDPQEGLFRQCLRGWATALKRINDIIHLWVFDIPGVDPATLGGMEPPVILGLENNLEDYERAHGIPDDCFPGFAEPDREVRKRHLIVKMSKLNVLNCADLVAIAKLMGKTITCQAGKDSELFTSGALSAADAVHTTVITFLVENPLVFTYTFEDREPPEEDGLLFADTDVGILECLFRKLVPSNSQVLFLFAPAT